MAKELDNKKMWESIIKNKTGFQNICEHTNWTKNYDWNNGTMTIYNLSKEEHLKVVEFLDCLRHPDVPETDFGKKELANSARTCKDSQELTEFGRYVKKWLGFNSTQPNEEDMSMIVKASKELLSIARKQIASEIDVGAMVSDTIICENLAYYRQGIEDTLKTIKGK